MCACWRSLETFHVEQLAEADDRVQRGAQLVAHERQELAFGAVRAVRADTGLQQLGPLALGMSLFGDVLEGADVAAWTLRIATPAGMQRALDACAGDDPVVKLKRGVAHPRPARDRLDGHRGGAHRRWRGLQRDPGQRSRTSRGTTSPRHFLDPTSTNRRARSAAPLEDLPAPARALARSAYVR